MIAIQLAVLLSAAPIVKVVVFSDRAEVTRAASAPCAAGKAVVSFAGLPRALDPRTLRADAEGRARAIGTTSRVVQVAKEDEGGPRAAPIRKELEELRARIRGLEDTLAGVDERAGSAAQFAEYALDLVNEEVRNAKPETAPWKDALDRVRDERNAAEKRKVELSAELRKLRRTEERLARRLASFATAGASEALDAEVAVECGPEAEARVRLAYVVGGATWNPEYDVRFEPAAARSKLGKGRVEITVGAVVRQSSGEDWSDVELVLSTSKPRLGTEAPYPAPIKVAGHEQKEAKVLVQAEERRESLTPGGAAAPAQAALQSAQLGDKGRAFTLTLPRKVTVLADGRPYWMPVDVSRGSGDARLVAVPKLRSRVFHALRFENPAPYPLLAGKIHAYRGGSYVGDSALEYKGPGEPVEVSLGIDEEVAIERKELEAVDRDASFLGTTKRMDRGWRIRVKNRAQEKVTVEIREGIPVSKIEKIKVDLDPRKTSGGYQLEAERGFVTWMLEVPAGGERAVDLGYAIKLPEDWRVGG